MLSANSTVDRSGVCLNIRNLVQALAPKRYPKRVNARCEFDNVDSIFFFFKRREFDRDTGTETSHKTSRCWLQIRRVDQVFIKRPVINVGIGVEVAFRVS
jgi:hypothetical protein